MMIASSVGPEIGKNAITDGQVVEVEVFLLGGPGGLWHGGEYTEGLTPDTLEVRFNVEEVKVSDDLGIGGASEPTMRNVLTVIPHWEILYFFPPTHRTGIETLSCPLLAGILAMQTAE